MCVCVFCFGVLVCTSNPFKGTAYRTKKFIVFWLSRQLWISRGRAFESWKGHLSCVEKPRGLGARSGTVPHSSFLLLATACRMIREASHCNASVVRWKVVGIPVLRAADSYVLAP